MVHERDEGHVGGTGGGSSPSAPDDVPGADEEPLGAGAVEVPLGLPVSGAEFRRLKEAARRPDRGDEDEAAAPGDQGRPGRAQEDQS